MKKRLLPLLLIFTLVMSFALTACGDNGATPDSATADESATGDSRTVSSGVSSKSASSASSEASSDASSSEDGDSPAKAVTPQQNNAAANDNDGGNGGGQDSGSAENNSDKGGSNQTSSKSEAPKSSSSKSASSVAPNPAYKDGGRPDFTIVLTNKANKQSFSAACSYTKDDDNLAYASFFLPGGEYDIAVYEYADKIDKSNPLVTWSYNNDIDAKKKKSIRVGYLVDENKIEVKENPSSQPKPSSQAKK